MECVVIRKSMRRMSRSVYTQYTRWSKPQLIERATYEDIMRILTAEQMQKVDAETIARVVPGIELMERAGRGVAKLIAARAERGKAVIFAGPGNNGGDGLVVARLLVAAGWGCSIHLLKTTDLTPDTAKNYQRINKKDIHEFDASRPDWPKRAPEDLSDAAVIVDAIFGTGAKGAPRGRAAEMITLSVSLDFISCPRLRTAHIFLVGAGSPCAGVLTKRFIDFQVDFE